MARKKSLLNKVKPIQHIAVDGNDLEKWLQAQGRLAELIKRVGSLRRDLPSFPSLSTMEHDDRLCELLEELNEAHSSLALEVIDLKLMLYSLLRVIGLSEAQLLEVLNPCTTAVDKQWKL
ncbi:hypothetical protein [Desulfopila aestuarii]|uniref:Uncharacterized protein n=1 Tax=Desulfopila aestuarii DSM 18488 TaxID=1121416 RepID=A0A1M7YK43_9BACT|nr:hypothetical protein [Desulfopila aestuarii]SHO52995.1 hypothetical protein SAMN02745220_04877 [Desulfopila aestuarii DSM 18488]